MLNACGLERLLKSYGSQWWSLEIAHAASSFQISEALFPNDIPVNQIGNWLKFIDENSSVADVIALSVMFQ